MKKSEMKIFKINDKKCEQYDITYKGNVIARLKLKDKFFTIRCPEWDGNMIYHAFPLGKNKLLDENERYDYLNKAKKEIKKHYKNKGDIK